MKINLAGYNIDLDILKSVEFESQELLTPEIFSAAYARISRSKKSVGELRKMAREDVSKARKSNKNIIFGMGHHSVAEHAVFNFDLIGVSRLALEEIERFRLVSYTEKSQRYVTLNGDYFTPKNLKDREILKLYNTTILKQNEFYKKAYGVLKEKIFKEYEGKSVEKRTLEGWAKEDARYILSLATKGQVGITINARNLEHLFRKFSLSKYTEVREIGNKLYSLVMDIAPSIILFPKPSEFEKITGTGYKEVLPEVDAVEKDFDIGDKTVGIVNHSPNGDDLILISLLTVNKKISYKNAEKYVQSMKYDEKKKVYKKLFESLEFFDTLPREFEMPDITFEAIISASNFAQLKRHRIATLLSSGYEIRYKNTIPERIIDAGLENEFMEIISLTNETYNRLKDSYKYIADYILTNSHRRKVLMKMNLRTLYHFARLRQDIHTQWDIRKLANELVAEVKKIMPLSSMLLCGKSEYSNLYKNIYNKEPKIKY